MHQNSRCPAAPDQLFTGSGPGHDFSQMRLIRVGPIATLQVQKHRFAGHCQISLQDSLDFALFIQQVNTLDNHPQEMRNARGHQHGIDLL